MSGALNSWTKLYLSAKVLLMETPVTLATWLQAHTEKQREAAAKKAGTTVAYLYQIAGGHRTPRPKLAQRIQEATGISASRLLGLADAA